MANDLLYKASLHLGASPQNKRSSLLDKIPTAGNRQQAVASLQLSIKFGVLHSSYNALDNGEVGEKRYHGLHFPPALLRLCGWRGRSFLRTVSS
jgi:hypothetical protein